MKNLTIKFFTICALIAFSFSVQAQTTIICSKGIATGINGSESSSLRATLDAEGCSNFSYVTLGEVTASTLSGCQVFFGAYQNAGGTFVSPQTLNPNEKTALANWTNNDGGYVIGSCFNNADLTAVCDALSIPVIPSGGNSGGNAFTPLGSVSSNCGISGGTTYAGGSVTGTFNTPSNFTPLATGGSVENPSGDATIISPNAVILGNSVVWQNFSIDNNPSNRDFMVSLFCNAAAAVQGMDGCVNTGIGISSTPPCNAGSDAPQFGNE